METVRLFFLLTLWGMAFCFGTEDYPFAGLPRLFISTEKSVPVMDRENEIEGMLEIQEDSAVGPKDARAITIRCRGNSSFKDMPKHSFRLHSKKAFSLLGLPAHKNWVLVTNYADRSLVRNKVTYALASALGAKGSPMTLDVELFINGSYEGVYLLTETPKDVARRTGLDETDYLVEIDAKYYPDDIVFFDRAKRPFNVKSPKSATPEQVAKIQRQVDEFEKFLSGAYPDADGVGKLSRWIDLEGYLRYYWIHEFSKNPDIFLTSTYFTWKEGEPFYMGPVWDFDVAYGIFPKETTYRGWLARGNGWNRALFKNPAFREAAWDYWKRYRAVFESVLDSVGVFAERLAPAAENNYRRWPILQDTQNRFHSGRFKNYREAVLSLKRWIRFRLNWIDEMQKSALLCSSCAL